MRELVKAAWGGGGSNLFGRMLAELFVGQSADAQTRELFDRMQRASTDRDTALAYLRAMLSRRSRRCTQGVGSHPDRAPARRRDCAVRIGQGGRRR